MADPFWIGLTGSIGMGKSTTARMFAEHGVAVWDADAAVARLYAPGGAGTRAVAALHPPAAGPEGVDRDRLKAWLDGDASRLARLEAAIHPLVAADRRRFAAGCTADIALADVPLLFETEQEDAYDLVVVVSAPPEAQRARVLARPGMTAGRFEAMLARQVPDAEKRARAGRVVGTGSIEGARADVARIVAGIRKGWHA